MSEKKTKELRKDLIAEWKARSAQFLKEVRSLSEKYRCDIIPQLVTTQISATESVVRAAVDIVDVSDKYEHIEPKENNA